VGRVRPKVFSFVLLGRGLDGGAVGVVLVWWICPSAPCLIQVVLLIVWGTF
jgi:hypothetical protein